MRYGRKSITRVDAFNFVAHSIIAELVMWTAGAFGDRLASYVVGFGDRCAGASPPELVFVSRDDSPVRVRVSTPRRPDVMRTIVVVIYKDRPRRVVLPVGVGVVNNGTDDKGSEITSPYYSHLFAIDCEHLINTAPGFKSP